MLTEVDKTEDKSNFSLALTSEDIY